MPVILSFVLHGALLVAGAELLVRGASRLAAAVGVSPLEVGLTVVAFGKKGPARLCQADWTAGLAPGPTGGHEALPYTGAGIV